MLELTPVTLKEANAFVALHHRHHRPVTGHKFSIGCSIMGELVGVAIVGRPVSRYLDDGFTLEVNRCVRPAKKMLVVFSMPPLGVQHRRWGIGKLLPTHWQAKTVQAFALRLEMYWISRWPTLDGKTQAAAGFIPSGAEIEI